MTNNWVNSLNSDLYTDSGVEQGAPHRQQILCGRKYMRENF